MTRHDLSVHLERKQERTTAELLAMTASDKLEERMLALAEAVRIAPEAFTADQAQALRNAAQVAGASADLIDGGIKL